MTSCQVVWSWPRGASIPCVLGLISNIMERGTHLTSSWQFPDSAWEDSFDVVSFLTISRFCLYKYHQSNQRCHKSKGRGQKKGGNQVESHGSCWRTSNRSAQHNGWTINWSAQHWRWGTPSTGGSGWSSKGYFQGWVTHMSHLHWRDSKPSNNCYCKQNQQPSLQDVPFYGLHEPSNWGFADSAIAHPPSAARIDHPSKTIDQNRMGLTDSCLGVWVFFGFDGFFSSLVCPLPDLYFYPIHVKASVSTIFLGV